MLDQFGYLAWVREAGEHGLISNLYDFEDSEAVYVQPMWLISGALWAIGLPIQVAFLIWKPVCVAVLFGGVLAYVRRTLDGRAARLAAVALALFYFPPTTVLLARTGLGSPVEDNLGYFLGYELSPATFLWGYVQTALSVGLMPIFVLALERLIVAERRAAGRGPWRYAAVAAGSGAMAAWAHPWQGMVLIGVGLVVVLLERRRAPLVPVLATLAATAAPLAYFAVIASIDPAWGEGSEVGAASRQWGWLLLALAPLVAFAVPGALGRRLRELDVQDRILLLWPLVTLAIYAALDRTFFYNVLSGLTIPLAVLAVRGARRVRAPLLAAAVVLLTLPGLANVVVAFREGQGADGSPRYLEEGEADALRFLDDSSRAGGVLTRLYLGQAVPGHSGRRSYVGHPVWTPHFAERVDATEKLFGGELPPGRAQAFVRSTGAGFVLEDCQEGRDVEPLLGPLVRRTHRFGCATVYEVGA